MAATSSNQRQLSPQLSTTFANVLMRGLDAATTSPAAADAAAAAPTVAAAKQQHRRSLMQAVGGRQLQGLVKANTSEGAAVLLSPGEREGAALPSAPPDRQCEPRSLTPPRPSPPHNNQTEQAFQIIRDGAYRLAAAQRVTLGAVAPPVGNGGVCVGPALLAAHDVDGFTTEFNCPGVSVPSEVRICLCVRRPAWRVQCSGSCADRAHAPPLAPGGAAQPLHRGVHSSWARVRAGRQRGRVGGLLQLRCGRGAGPGRGAGVFGGGRLSQGTPRWALKAHNSHRCVCFNSAGSKSMPIINGVVEDQTHLLLDDPTIVTEVVSGVSVACARLVLRLC